MKKSIVLLDLFLHLAILLIGTGFLVAQNTPFATQMFYICWLPFCIYIAFSLAGFKEFPNAKQSLYSVLNFCFLGALLALNQMIPLEFFLSIILAELVAVSFAISYFFLFKKGLNDVSAKDIFGQKGAILLAVFFTGIIYPYIADAFIYIQDNGASVYLILAFTTTVILGAIRQIKSIEALVKKKNENPKSKEKALEEALDRSKPMDFDTKVILISLGLWFLGIGTIWAIYVNNA